MSTLPVPTSADEIREDRERTAHAIYRLSIRFLREPSIIWDADPPTLMFTPDLTAPEQATYDKIVSYVRSPVPLTRGERDGIQADIDGLVTYQNLANPTLAQTVLAVKAQSRILRAILRS